MILGVVEKDFFDMFENFGNQLRVKAKSDSQYTICVIGLTLIDLVDLVEWLLITLIGLTTTIL